MNDWTKFVTKYYHDKKRTNKNYKFKDAMKDARSEYKKGGNVHATPKPTMHGGRKTRKSKK